MAAKTFQLTYTYVPDMLERRQPHRAQHLEHLQRAQSNLKLVLAGAYADPVDGAVLIVEAEEPQQVFAWLAEDPYNRAGLIRGATVREVNLAVRP